MARPRAITEISIDEAKEQFDSLIASVRDQNTEVVLKENGQAVARIVPSNTQEEARRAFIAEAQTWQRSFDDVPTRELERMIDRAVAEVRSKRKKVARA